VADVIPEAPIANWLKSRSEEAGVIPADIIQMKNHGLAWAGKCPGKASLDAA
jgi:hypothetical protein